MSLKRAVVSVAMIVLLGAAGGVTNQALAQSISEFPVPTARPFVITAGPDGALWFTEQDENIGRITTSGAITEYLTPTYHSGPNSITTGPDGALWFTENGANQIGRITTTGVITEFPIPTSNSGASGITAGPDGALWFIEAAANQIGRITTAGVITNEFPIPSGAAGITTGPDGAIWFTENTANKIGRITTAGVVTNEFPIPTAGGAGYITTGPDGALWFNETNKIGRITTAGVITEFPVPMANSGLEAIAAGPDGALWFAEQFGNKIGRITTAGVITEFPVPTANSYPTGITAGADGAIWFTENNANKIGRLVLPALQVSPTTNIVASGKKGGPFSPTSFQYQLTATVGSANYAISGIPIWLNANFTTGTATTSPVTVTFSLINVGNLAPGPYMATIAFTNTSYGLGNTTRTATLTVYAGTKDGCGNGGWQNYVSFPGPFENQGQCVSYFAKQ